MVGRRDTVTDDELATGLGAWADGSHPIEAAVGLLVAHRSWLLRRDFRQRAISVDPARQPDGPVWVGVDWDSAARVLSEVPASSSENGILAIAVALASGREHPVDLGDALGSLDATNTARVLQAVAHSAGLHERRLSLVIDGRIEEEGIDRSGAGLAPSGEIGVRRIDG